MCKDGFVFQSNTTVQGAADEEKVIQSAPRWFDASDYRFVVVRAVVRAFTNCELKLETSPTRDSGESSTADSAPDSNWREAVANITQSGTYVLDAAPGATYPLDRFVRWTVKSTAASWTSSFWFGMTPKK